MKEREDDRRDEAEDLFARRVEEKEAGQASPFEEFMARHAEHARELERLFVVRRTWSRFESTPGATGARGVEEFLAGPRLPRWDENGAIDFCYWYLGTQALSRLKGPRWDRWNEALKDAVIDHQRANESEHELGSWDPVDPWSHAGGRVYATAILALTLEATLLRR